MTEINEARIVQINATRQCEKTLVEAAKNKFRDFMSNKGMIAYIRDESGKPTGMVVAARDGKKVLVGVSHCNFKAGDKWNKYLGLEYALKNATPLMTINKTGTVNMNVIGVEKFDQRSRFHVRAMLMRAATYYK